MTFYVFKYNILTYMGNIMLMFNTDAQWRSLGKLTIAALPSSLINVLFILFIIYI